MTEFSENRKKGKEQYLGNPSPPWKRRRYDSLPEGKKRKEQKTFLK